MNKFTLSVVASAAVLLAACGKKEEAPVAAAPAASAAPAAPAPTELVIKIGHVGPTSGAIAHLGKDNEMGARMAIDDLNAKGVMIGGQKAKFELLAEDDAADPKQGTAVAQKLVDAKVQGVIGHLNSGTTIPASQIYNTAGIPQISPSATNPKYTRQGFNTTFRALVSCLWANKIHQHVVNQVSNRRKRNQLMILRGDPDTGEGSNQNERRYSDGHRIP